MVGALYHHIHTGEHCCPGITLTGRRKVENVVAGSWQLY